MPERRYDPNVEYDARVLVQEIFWTLSYAPVYLINPGGTIESIDRLLYKAIYDILLQATFSGFIRKVMCAKGQLLVLRDDALELVVLKNLPYHDLWQDEIVKIKARLGKTNPTKKGEQIALPKPPKYPTHGRDFRSVYWFGKTYTFTSKQAGVVECLWEAWEKGYLDVSWETLKDRAGIAENARFHDVFPKKKVDIKGLIIPGGKKGTYRLKI